MTEPTVDAAGDGRLALLDALIYADVFDCAATLDELWRFNRTAVGREALRERLRDDPGLRQIVVERGGLYCFEGRPDLIDERRTRIERAQSLQHRARRVARVIRHLPFVRGLALTGSAAADDAAADADLDVLVIVAPERLGTVFVLLGSASRLLRRRLFCPNYYLCEGHCGMPPGNVYLAREIAQARELIGDTDELREANPWLETIFPNLPPPESAPEGRLRPGTRLQRLLEAPLRGGLGDRVEGWARRVALSRLRSHYAGLGHDIPADVAETFATGASLRFHGRDSERTTLKRYAARRVEVASRLEQIDRERGAAAAATGEGA